jgi:hypothetical protein
MEQSWSCERTPLAMAATVEDGAALRTDEMRIASRLAATLGGAALARLAFAERAVARGAQAGCSFRGSENPRPHLERRSVTDVLPVSAVELGDPVAVCVSMKAGDLPLHRSSGRQ